MHIQTQTLQTEYKEQAEIRDKKSCTNASSRPTVSATAETSDARRAVISIQQRWLRRSASGRDQARGPRCLAGPAWGGERRERARSGEERRGRAQRNPIDVYVGFVGNGAGAGAGVGAGVGVGVGVGVRCGGVRARRRGQRRRARLERRGQPAIVSRSMVSRSMVSTAIVSRSRVSRSRVGRAKRPPARKGLQWQYVPGVKRVGVGVGGGVGAPG